MPGPLTWRELTERNKQALRDALKELNSNDRIRVMEIAGEMIKTDHFDSPSAKWNAFLNTVAIVVAGLG